MRYYDERVSELTVSNMELVDTLSSARNKALVAAIYNYADKTTCTNVLAQATIID